MAAEITSANIKYATTNYTHTHIHLHVGILKIYTCYIHRERE